MKKPGSRAMVALAVALVALGVAAEAWLPSSRIDGGGALGWTAATVDRRVPLLRIQTFQARRRALAPSFHHPRCMNCHGFNVPNAIGQAHIADGRAVMNCVGCHGILTWHAPAAMFDLESKTIPQICDFIKLHAGNDPVVMANHLKHDPLIQWAVSNAVVPVDGVLQPGGKAPPGDLAIWNDRIDRWTAAGMPC